MDKQRWQALQAIFHQALERPPEERQAYVDAHAPDPELRQEILDLLDAEHADDLLVDPAAAILADDLNLEGARIGNYQVIEQIGTGGMGSVYLASRADGAFDKQVAVKIVKKGMDSAAVVERFAQERQILASLNHPHIAGVLDGGVTPDGRPYFVMEYVNGIPLTEYCDEQKLSISRRLQLFRQVCDAVHYAHRNLIVHRDLKPNNILVTSDGELKLLDFGIAKLLEQRSDELQTQTGAILATPAYAAPEQLTGGAITTGTDVYALGVLLYELLAGRRPFEAMRTPQEYQALILSGDPIRPSTAITQMPMATEDGQAKRDPTTLAATRSVAARQLRSLLRGDLDTICLTALMREPERRYDSVSALADDVSLHLQGLPIQARPASLLYRARKFYNRHQIGVFASACVALAFIGLAGYYTTAITQERDLALTEKARTEEVVRFVTGLFRAADPAQAKGEDVTAREILAAGVTQLETEMQDRPKIQATMRRVLGEVYFELGVSDTADELLNKALSTQLEATDTEPLDIARTYLALGMHEQTIGNFDAAAQAFEKTAAIRAAELPADHYDVLEVVSAEAFLQETLGNYDEARVLHEKALAMAKRLASDAADPTVAFQMAKLASVIRLQDKPQEAEPLLREALAIADQIYGGPHPTSDETRRQLAELLTELRQFEEAQAMFETLIDSRTRTLGPNHYETGSAWNSYGHLLSEIGDDHGAIDAYNKMLEITRNAYGDTHPSLAAGYNNVAVMSRNLEDLSGAEESYKLSIAMQDAVGLEPDHPNRAYPMAGLGRVMLLQRRFTEALEQFQNSFNLRKAHFDDNHVLQLELLSDLGAALTELGRHDEAEPLLQKSYTGFEENWGLDDPRTQLTAARLVRLYSLTNQPALVETYIGNASTQEQDQMLRYF
ncbi:MAG: tetratricopeptide repeat protein [bacterium]